jgi:TOMM system kinase/cyclase fusion protein
MDSTQAIGAVFRGRYELLNQLGEGGFGTVYKARQVATGQAVAIKVLRLQEGAVTQVHEKRIARFQREMQICAQMHHPNIVRLMDSGQAEGGIVYSIFEFVPGKNLAEVLAEEGRLDPAEAKHFMLQALDALACAHVAGVVHRDLKPANIMVIPTGARRNAVVLDFGIGALTQEARREEKERITITNESIGTPSYAAPEQLRGLPPTPRSDLYSWGLVFLECLTGKRVVDGDTVPEVIFKQLSADPIPIPDSIADHPLGKLLRRVTTKDPAAREVTAEGVMRELEACDVSGLRQKTAPVRLQHAPPDAATATVDIGYALRGGASSQRLVEGERRQITAVCCSLSATAAGPKAADVEELDQILGVQQEACTEIARRFDGHVAGALGDAVLFYFGYPTAREDDARRATRAALAMVAEIQRRSAVLATERKVRVDVRIGIHTGVVVSRELRDPTPTGLGYVVGTTPKLAARLSSLAEPGTILVSGGTQRLIRKNYVFEPSGVRAVDDSTAPVEVFILRDGNPNAGIHDLPLVGRDREIETLLDRWSRARGGVGQAVLIGGEPGIGKSRLARELDERIGDEPHVWLECRCTPDSANSAFYPIVDLLDRLLDPQREVRPEGKVDKLEALLSLYGFDLSEAMPLFAPLLSISLPKKWTPLDVSPQKQREMTRNAVLSLLFEMAEKEPVVLVIEDLHWADPSTVELLGQFTGEVASARVLAIFTARPEFSAPWPSTSLLQLHLGRLGRPEVEQMASKVTSGRTLPPEVLDQIATRTDGIPLFVEELILAMIEASVLAERDGGYALTKPLADVSIPATLRDSLVARLDRLGRAKETAQVAAAIGREFTFELLRAVIPLDEAAVQQDLDRLVAAELVYRKRRLKNPAYLFKHALVRDAAYESMLMRSRREVHAQIARALEEKFAELVNERPELLAHHHAAAEQKREALGYLQKAAMGALARSELMEALAHANQGMTWLGALEDSTERTNAELGLNGVLTTALMATRGFSSQEVQAAIQRSQELLGGASESPHAFPTLGRLILYYISRGNYERAVALERQCLDLAEQTENVEIQSSSLALLGQAQWGMGHHQEAMETLKRSVSLYEVEAQRKYLTSIGLDNKTIADTALGLVLWFTGYPDQALAAAKKAVEWARELKHANSLVMALVYLGGVHQYRQERDRVREVAASILELTDRHGFGHWAPLATLLREWADGQGKNGALAIDGMRAIGQLYALPYWSSLVAEVDASAGRIDAALVRLDECVKLALEMGEAYYIPELHRLRGVLSLRRDPGAVEAAEKSFLEAITIAQSQGAKMLELRATRDLARLLGGLGRMAEARERLAAIRGWFTEGFDTADLVETQALLDSLSR